MIYSLAVSNIQAMNHIKVGRAVGPTLLGDVGGPTLPERRAI